ncbi:DUF397 domain-containing protein [Streptomyces sp. NPDC086091]|uniref:DUF397 domain-containing protein n=1 Tax=unclassified Streptomyces TaxID=2593676 RepID=UPI00382DC696
MTTSPRHAPVRPSPRACVPPQAAAGLRWRRSSYSTGANNCVETARPAAGPWAGLLAVRDSKDPAGPALLFTAASWTDFTAALR